VGIALFRIVQEALTNVVKYAGARAISIDLIRDDEGVSLIIADDGVGLPESASRDRLSHGIAGMRQRVRALAGEFMIHGEAHRGTQIEVRIPLSRDATRESESPAAPPDAAIAGQLDAPPSVTPAET
jgi:signal transduction histidine kinase